MGAELQSAGLILARCECDCVLQATLHKLIFFVKV